MKIELHIYHHTGAEDPATLPQIKGQLTEILEGIKTIMSNTAQLDTDVQSVITTFGDLKTRVQAEFDALNQKVASGDTISQSDLSGLEQLSKDMTAFHQQIAANPPTGAGSASNAGSASASSPTPPTP